MLMEKPLVLIVEDEPPYREGAVQLIESILPQGWEVLAPSTLEEAKLYFLERRLQVVLLDDGLASYDYQGLSGGSVRGFRLARNVGASAQVVAFSKAKNHLFAYRTTSSFDHKLNLLSASLEGEGARENFLNLLRGIFALRLQNLTSPPS